MSAPGLAALLGKASAEAVAEVADRWLGDPGAAADRAAVLDAVAEAMGDPDRVEARLRELSDKLAGVLETFVARPGAVRSARDLHEAAGRSFRSRFEIDAALAALHREGFLFPGEDPRWAGHGEPCFAIPDELVEGIAALRRRQEGEIRQTITLQGFLQARYFAERADDADAVAARAEKICKMYAIEESVCGRVAKLPAGVRRVLEHVLAHHGGLMATDLLPKEFDDDELVDLEEVRRHLEESMLGTVAPLPLSRYGIQPVEQAIVVFHEIARLGPGIVSDAARIEVDSALSSGVDLVSNASRFLRELGSSKVQFTADGRLYKASQKRIAKLLLDLPGGYLSAEAQIGFLYRFFLSRRLIDRSGERALRPTPEGLEFDRLDLRDKLRHLLAYCVEEQGLPGEHYHQVHLRRILLRLLKGSEPEQWYEVLQLPFLARNAWLCQLERERAGGFFAGRFKGGGYVPTENLQQVCWNLTLFVKQRLYPLGIVDLGLREGRQVAVRLSRLGAELLHAEEAGEQERAPSSAVVNPDFEVIVYPGDDEHEVVHLFDRFARRLKSDYLHHFRLDRESLRAGLRDGLPFAQILDELRSRSRAPLPQNVVYSLQDWADDAGLVSLEEERVLSARKPEVLDRFLALAPVEPHVERRLSPTRAKLRQDAPVGDLQEVVREMGFVLEGPA